MGIFSDIGGGVGGFFGGLIGEALANGDQQRADQLRQQAFNEIKNTKIPDIEKEKIYLQLMQADPAGPTAYEKISPDFEAAQRGVQARLTETATSKGMDAQARSALNAAQRQVAREEQGQRAAITSNMQQRGISGSGLEFASKMANQQAAAERGSVAGAQAAGDGARRAMEANLQVANVSGQMYGQQARAADARDMLNRFNTQARNDANRFNAETGQRQETYNKSLIDRDFQRRRQQARDMYAAYQDQAEGYDRKADRTRRIGYEGGKAVGTAGGAAVDVF